MTGGRVQTHRGTRAVVDDKGYSLVEMIIVIAIMAVLVASVGLSVGLISTKPARKCADQLRAVLTEHRSRALGKADSKAIVRIGDKGEIFLDEYYQEDVKTAGITLAKSTVVGEKRVLLSYEEADGTVVPMGPGDEVELCFDRNGGTLKSGPAIFRSAKGNKTYKVTIHKLTGKIDAELEP